jgi:chromosome segregation ATPase
MNKFSKPLVVFTAAAAIAFLGFTAVSSVGGPNWTAEANEVSPDYAIVGEPGEKVTWKVTDNATGQNVSVSKSEVQGAAVIAARKHLAGKQKEEIDKLNAETAKAQADLETAKKYREVDTEAMQKRMEELTAKLEAVNKEILDTRAESVKKSQEAQAIRAEAERRRGDVFRLQRELAEIQSDLYQAKMHQEYLRDHLERLNGMIGPLERRHEQLEQQAK